MKKIWLVFLMLAIIPLAFATYTVTVNLQTPANEGNFNASSGDFCFNVTGDFDSGDPFWNTTVNNEAIDIFNLSSGTFGYTQHGDVTNVLWIGSASLNCNLTDDKACGNFTDSGYITLNRSFATVNKSKTTYAINYSYGKRPTTNVFFDCYLFQNSTGLMNSTSFPLTNLTGIIAHRGEIATYYGEGVRNASFAPQYCFHNIDIPNFVGNKTWGIFCRAVSNTSDYNRINDSSNRRTFWNDYTNPSITVNGPSDEASASSTTVTINITAIDDNADKCQLWTDFNGTYQTNTSEIRSYTNNTWFNFTPITAPTTVAIFNEAHNISSNSVTVDLIDAGISSVSIGNTSFTALCSASASVTCNYTSSTGVIVVNTTMGAGNQRIYVNYTYADREKHWKVICNDSVGRSTTAGNYTVYIESTSPAIFDIRNATYSYTGFTIYWNTSENTNGSIKWGTTSAVTDGNATSTSSFTTTHSAVINNLVADKLYYFNMTNCDIYGNCNSTQGSINFGFPIYPTWNWYPVLEVGINLQNISYQSGATTVSWFNQTGQEFISFINGTSTNGDVALVRGDAIALYSNIGNVWNNRNLTNSQTAEVLNETGTISSGAYTLSIIEYGIDAVSIGNSSFTTSCSRASSVTCNFTSAGVVTANLTIGDTAVSFNYTYQKRFNFSFVNGSNFIGILNGSAETFGILDTIDTFSNLSSAGASDSTNISAMAYFNNTNSSWRSHFWNWSIENATVIPNNTVLWVAALNNFTWNRR